MGQKTKRMPGRRPRGRLMMCPFFIATTPIGYCGCYGDGALHPSFSRKKKYCFGKFIACAFYQFEARPFFGKPAHKSKKYKM